jgi:uncharacterized pyridoxamine 5'-phosphate oxidase family protein
VDEVETRAIAAVAIAPRADINVSSNVAVRKMPLRAYPARGSLYARDCADVIEFWVALRPSGKGLKL